MVSLRILQLEKVLEIDPADFTLHFGLGQAYGEEQQWERVAAAYRKAIEFKPDYAAAYNDLSNALRALGPSDELRQVWNEGTKAGDHIPTQKMRVRLNRLKKEKSSP